MKTIDKIVSKMDKVEVFEMPNVFVVGVANEIINFKMVQVAYGANSLITSEVYQ